VLWHMKKEVELSHLAQDAVAIDRLSPHSWCVMGNCFSLQKVRGGGAPHSSPVLCVLAGPAVATGAPPFNTDRQTDRRAP
jgi:hypothetical protein